MIQTKFGLEFGRKPNLKELCYVIYKEPLVKSAFLELFIRLLLVKL